MTEAAGLILVATPIGNLGDLSPRAVEVLGAADAVACEDTRRTGRLFAHAGITHSPFIVCNEHTEATAAAEIVRRIDAGATVALVSDAGMPGVSDPGQRVVDAVIAAGHRVTAVPGANAVLMALTISGLPTDRFVFDGFLPRKGSARAESIADIASQARTTVVYESPKRVAKTLSELHEVCGPDRPVAIARELTKRFEEVWRGSLGTAVARFVDANPKGEFVIVIGGAEEQAPTDDELTTRLRQRLDAGDSRRDAVDAVVASSNATKRQVYDLALRIDLEPDA